MPYSRDPGKFPPELQMLPELLMHTSETTFTIPVESRSVAFSKRTQIQAFFAAVRHKAEEMRAIADRMLDKRLKAAQLAAPTRANAPSATPEARAKAIRMTEDDIHEAEGVARTWEDRDEALCSWMVRAVERQGGWAVEITKRTLGAFGKTMLEIVGNSIPRKPAVENGSTCGVQTTMPQTSEPITARPRLDDPAGPAAQERRVLVTEGSQPATDTTLEAQLAMLRQAAAGLQPDNGR